MMTPSWWNCTVTEGFNKQHYNSWLAAYAESDHPMSSSQWAVIALVAGSFLSGCPSPFVALRPDGSPGPQRCPEKALETMRILHLRPGDSADADIDTSQADQTPISLNDGPV